MQCLHYSSSISQLTCDLDNTLTSPPHEVYLNIISIRVQELNHPCSESFLSSDFISEYSNVFHTLYLRLFCATTMLIPPSSPTKSSNQTHDSIYKNVSFRHSLFHDKSSSLSCDFYDSASPLSILLSYRTVPVMQTFNLGSYMAHQVSTTAFLFSFKSVSFPSIFYLIWDTGASISILPSKDDFISPSKPKIFTALRSISKWSMCYIKRVNEMECTQ